MNASTVNINLQVPVRLTRSRDEKWYIAYCSVFDLSSQGKTEKKARENLSDALSLFFLSCIERGTFDAVMKESGITLNHLTKRKSSKEEDTYLDVPLHFLIPDNSESARCHA